MDLALFDFDGTLTVTDTYVPFLRYSSSRLRWVTGSVFLLPLTLAYRLGALKARHVRALASRWAFTRRSELELKRLGSKFADEVLPTLIQTETLDRVIWHQHRGDDVVVVSAGLNFYLSPWCKAHNLALLSTQMSSVNGRLNGGYQGLDCSGTEKSRRIREVYDLTRYEHIRAYGDTNDDYPMLRLASHRILRGNLVDELPDV